MFDDGDTLAEADYREAVAHCLDPIGVNASTADLVSKDTCAISMVKEERAARKAKKMLKSLRESDFTELTDEELRELDAIQDAVRSDEDLDAEHMRIWAKILDQMGYTQEEWDKLTPEQQDKVWRASEEPVISKSGFSPYHIGVDPKTGKKFKYQNKYEVFVPAAKTKPGSD